MAYSN